MVKRKNIAELKDDRHLKVCIILWALKANIFKSRYLPAETSCKMISCEKDDLFRLARQVPVAW